MPSAETGSHAAVDASYPHHDTADYRTTLLARLDALHELSIGHINTFGPLTQQKDLCLVKIKEAKTHIRSAVKELEAAEAGNEHLNTRQEREHLEAKALGRNTEAIEQRHTQELAAAREAVENTRESLKSAVDELSPTLQNIFARPVAVENKLSQEEKDSRDTIRALSDEIRILSERLRLPLGHIDLETYADTYPQRYNALKDTIELYRLFNNKPGNRIAQQRFDLLQNALSGIKGGTALEKIDALSTQLIDYQRGTPAQGWIARFAPPNGLRSKGVLEERWAQLDFALHASREQIEEQIRNPRATFRNWRYDPPETL
ncbi:MAG TPA: hypothetical protein VFA10_01110 [Ktedonobacteraceae bacterium]|nr:hypothetical protein [Ktedonobacteraceae bacterium]